MQSSYMKIISAIFKTVVNRSDSHCQSPMHAIASITYTIYQYVKIDILSIEAIYANLVQAYVHIYKHQQGTCSLRYVQ